MALNFPDPNITQQYTSPDGVVYNWDGVKWVSEYGIPPKGEPGIQGPQGPAGNDGSDGQDGQDGQDGAPGTSSPESTGADPNTLAKRNGSGNLLGATIQATVNLGSDGGCNVSGDMGCNNITARGQYQGTSASLSSFMNASGSGEFGGNLVAKSDFYAKSRTYFQGSRNEFDDQTVLKSTPNGGGNFVTQNPTNKIVTSKGGAFYNLDIGVGRASLAPSSDVASSLILGMTPYLWTDESTGDKIIKPHSSAVPDTASILRMDDGSEGPTNFSEDGEEPTPNIPVGSLETLISLLVLTTQRLNSRLTAIEQNEIIDDAVDSSLLSAVANLVTRIEALES